MAFATVQDRPPAFWAESHRDVVQVAGPDALAYLQGQASQDLAPLAVGASRWTFLLQPTGRIDVLARVWRRGDDTFVLDTDAGFGDVLASRLERFKIRVRAELEPLAWRCLAVRGAAERPAGAVVAWWDRDHDLLGADPPPPGDVTAAGPDVLEQARVVAGWPAMGAEIVPGETIPAETGITSVAVSYTKGCYPGQELVERMDSRGAAPPRHLAVLTVADGARPGDPIARDGADVGVLTSVAGDRALGYLRRGVTAN